MAKIKKILNIAFVAVVGVTISVFTMLPVNMDKAEALSASDWDASYIIDDALFYRRSSMSVNQIQNFLNARGQNCQGDNCIKNYRTNTSAKSDSGLCSAIPARSNRTAAQIIHEVSNACRIDSKVLIVKLQKEQGLITRTNATNHTYQRAMGYFCPDDPNNPGWCHPDYAGFFNQTYNAARQLQNYRQNPNSFNFAAGRRSFVAYQANAPQCGGTHITMQNAATAGLYNYTPYQPNQAALNNLYGTGNSCSAYGNRNFWRMYNDWFGPTKIGGPGAVYRLYNANTNNHLYTTSVRERNNAVANANFRFEGLAFRACTSGGTAVYRLYNPSTGRHLFTTSTSERNRAASQTNFRTEGTAFRVCGSKPVYRLYSAREEKHFYTSSISERNNLNRNTSFRYEGIAFRVR